jgi:hypothetical protein
MFQVKPNVMVEVIDKNNQKRIVNLDIVPEMMELGEFIKLTGNYEIIGIEDMKIAAANAAHDLGLD